VSTRFRTLELLSSVILGINALVIIEVDVLFVISGSLCCLSFLGLDFILVFFVVG